MRSEEEIKKQITYLEEVRHIEFGKIKSQGSANIRVARFYNFAIEQLKWVLKNEK